MRKGLKKLAVLLLAALAVVSIAGCQPQKAGVLRVGTSADYPPYEFRANIDGEVKIVGFEMEMARYIAKELNMDIEIVDMDFEGILGAINAGTVDIGIAAMSIDSKRLEAVDFTDVYYVGKQSALILTSNKDKYNSFESLDNARVGVQLETIHEKLAKEKIPGAQIKGYPQIPEMVLDLKAKNLDILVLDYYVAQGYIRSQKDLMDPNLDFGAASDDDSYAIAIKKGSDEMRGKINKIIEKIKKDNLMSQWVLDADEQLKNIVESEDE